jgi:hypothetical protein
VIKAWYHWTDEDVKSGVGRSKVISHRFANMPTCALNHLDESGGEQECTRQAGHYSEQVHCDMSQWSGYNMKLFLPTDTTDACSLARLLARSHARSLARLQTRLKTRHHTRSVEKF